MKKLLLILSFTLGVASSVIAEDLLCQVNGKFDNWFQGYQAEQIMLHGDILYSERDVDIHGKPMTLNRRVFYHVMLTPEKLGAAMIKGSPNLECISFGLYICTVGLGDDFEVFYDCKTYQE